MLCAWMFSLTAKPGPFKRWTLSFSEICILLSLGCKNLCWATLCLSLSLKILPLALSQFSQVPNSQKSNFLPFLSPGYIEWYCLWHSKHWLTYSYTPVFFNSSSCRALFLHWHLPSCFWVLLRILGVVLRHIFGLYIMLERYIRPCCTPLGLSGFRFGGGVVQEVSLYRVPLPHSVMALIAICSVQRKQGDSSPLPPFLHQKEMMGSCW